MQPLSNAGIFLVALTGVLIGKPFVREFAEVGPVRGGDQERAVRFDHRAGDVDLGRRVRRYDGVLGDPADRGPRCHDPGHEVPAVLRLLLGNTVRAAGLAVLASRVLLDRMIAEATSPHTVRRTTFVAFARTGNRPAVLPCPAEGRTRGRCRDGTVRRQDRQSGSSADRRRVTRVMARELQGARAAALVQVVAQHLRTAGVPQL